MKLLTLENIIFKWLKLSLRIQTGVSSMIMQKNFLLLIF